jgi:hypothetical protein
MARNTLTATTRGDREVIAAFARLHRVARKEAKDGAERIARGLAVKTRRAARREGRQAARAARTVRTQRGPQGGDPAPRVVVGPHPLLFGSEFGMTRRSGWYARGRYWDSPGRQFKPHLRRGSYWFFTTQDEERAAVNREWADVVAAIVRKWSA